MSTVSPSTGHGSRGEWAMLLLSAASGAADAFVFICVGQVFAGVMTGNLVLLGASAVGTGEHGAAPRVLTALAGYGVGVAFAAWAAERLRWPPPVTLLFEVALLAAGAALWWLDPVGSDRDRLGLLALISTAMGIQGRVLRTPTNYFTGTLTSLLGRTALRSWQQGDRWVSGRLLAVVVGAAVTALAVRVRPDVAAAVAVVPAAGALLIEAAPWRWTRG
ncbi:YoaK family protein [Streptomyces sp. NPDC014734]|uniref:YoaK family protein n=1 Tax=Streptomyces sp. NPDC014734 TaxID=3364886 RepID=UPI0036FE2524